MCQADTDRHVDVYVSSRCIRVYLSPDGNQGYGVKQYEAVSRCVDDGGVLVTIDTQAIFSAIKNKLSGNALIGQYGIQAFWIGLQKFLWKWINGEILQFSSFRRKQLTKFTNAVNGDKLEQFWEAHFLCKPLFILRGFNTDVHYFNDHFGIRIGERVTDLGIVEVGFKFKEELVIMWRTQLS